MRRGSGPLDATLPAPCSPWWRWPASVSFLGAHGVSDRVGDLIRRLRSCCLLCIRSCSGSGPAEQVSQSLEERRRARELVESFGSDSLAFFTLSARQELLLLLQRNAFLAYSDWSAARR